jgi:hypothetical protein
MEKDDYIKIGKYIIIIIFGLVLVCISLILNWGEISIFKGALNCYS